MRCALLTADRALSPWCASLSRTVTATFTPVSVFTHLAKNPWGKKIKGCEHTVGLVKDERVTKGRQNLEENRSVAERSGGRGEEEKRQTPLWRFSSEDELVPHNSSRVREDLRCIKTMDQICFQCSLK